MILLQNDTICIRDSLTLKTNTKGEKHQLKLNVLTYYNKNYLGNKSTLLFKYHWIL